MSTKQIPVKVSGELYDDAGQAGVLLPLFATIHQSERFRTVYEPVPAKLVEKYVDLGLPTKADALIGAFVEWVGAKYLVSDNRHFLQEFSTDAYEVLPPAEFLRRFEAGEL